MSAPNFGTLNSEEAIIEEIKKLPNGIKKIKTAEEKAAYRARKPERQALKHERQLDRQLRNQGKEYQLLLNRQQSESPKQIASEYERQLQETRQKHADKIRALLEQQAKEKQALALRPARLQAAAERRKANKVARRAQEPGRYEVIVGPVDQKFMIDVRRLSQRPVIVTRISLQRLKDIRESLSQGLIGNSEARETNRFMTYKSLQKCVPSYVQNWTCRRLKSSDNSPVYTPKESLAIFDVEQQYHINRILPQFLVTRQQLGRGTCILLNSHHDWNHRNVLICPVSIDIKEYAGEAQIPLEQIMQHISQTESADHLVSVDGVSDLLPAQDLEVIKHYNSALVNPKSELDASLITFDLLDASLSNEIGHDHVLEETWPMTVFKKVKVGKDSYKFIGLGWLEPTEVRLVPRKSMELTSVLLQIFRPEVKRLRSEPAYRVAWHILQKELLQTDWAVWNFREVEDSPPPRKSMAAVTFSKGREWHETQSTIQLMDSDMSTWPQRPIMPPGDIQNPVQTPSEITSTSQELGSKANNSLRDTVHKMPLKTRIGKPGARQLFMTPKVQKESREPEPIFDRLIDVQSPEAVVGTLQDTKAVPWFAKIAPIVPFSLASQSHESSQDDGGTNSEGIATPHNTAVTSVNSMTLPKTLDWAQTAENDKDDAFFSRFLAANMSGSSSKHSLPLDDLEALQPAHKKRIEGNHANVEQAGPDILPPQTVPKVKAWTRKPRPYDDIADGLGEYTAGEILDYFGGRDQSWSGLGGRKPFLSWSKDGDSCLLIPTRGLQAWNLNKMFVTDEYLDLLPDCRTATTQLRSVGLERANLAERLAEAGAAAAKAEKKPIAQESRQEEKAARQAEDIESVRSDSSSDTDEANSPPDDESVKSNWDAVSDRKLLEHETRDLCLDFILPTIIYNDTEPIDFRPTLPSRVAVYRELPRDFANDGEAEYAFDRWYDYHGIAIFYRRSRELANLLSRLAIADYRKMLTKGKFRSKWARMQDSRLRKERMVVQMTALAGPKCPSAPPVIRKRPLADTRVERPKLRWFDRVR